MLNLYTASIYSFKDVGKEVLDITRMTGKEGAFLAPSWELLRPYLYKRKSGVLSSEDWETYRASYLQEMRESQRTNPDDWATWRSFIQSEATFEFTLVCYCENFEQCHRTVIANYFAESGAVYLGERQQRLL